MRIEEAINEGSSLLMDSENSGWFRSPGSTITISTRSTLWSGVSGSPASCVGNTLPNNVQNVFGSSLATRIKYSSPPTFSKALRIAVFSVLVALLASPGGRPGPGLPLD